MANRGLRHVPTAPSFRLPRNADGTVDPADLVRLADEVAKLQSILRGGISLGNGNSSSLAGSLRGQYIDYVFAAANTVYNIPHGLGKVPTGYLVVLQDRAADIYDSNFGVGWGALTISLYSSVASAKVKLIVFA